jgi:hypothetical protein
MRTDGCCRTVDREISRFPYKEAIGFLFLEGPWQTSRTLMSDLILGEVLLSARHIVEIATLLLLQTAKREKLYPGRQLIEAFSPHSSLIADRSCRRSESYSPAPLAIASENDRSRMSDASHNRNRSTTNQ